MKQWFAFTCPVCGFRYPPKKFNKADPIAHPFQIVTGGGRGKGFRVLKYLPWSTLPMLKQTKTWTNVLFLYDRLGSAYDQFFEVLGFLSPQMKALLLASGSYAHAYRTSQSSIYSGIYASQDSLNNVEPYSEEDYSKVYSQPSLSPVIGGIKIE